MNIKKLIITGCSLIAVNSAVAANSSENWNEFTNANNIYKEAYFNLLEMRLRHHSKLEKLKTELANANDEWQKQSTLRTQLQLDLSSSKNEQIATDATIKDTLGKIVLEKVLARRVADEYSWRKNPGDDLEQILINSRTDIALTDQQIGESAGKIQNLEKAIVTVLTQPDYILLKKGRDDLNRSVIGKQVLLEDNQTRKIRIKSELKQFPKYRVELIQSERLLKTQQRELEKATKTVDGAQRRLTELASASGDKSEATNLKHYLGIDRSLWLQISEANSFNKYNAAVTNSQTKVTATENKISGLKSSLDAEEVMKSDLVQIDIKIAGLSAELIEDKKQLKTLSAQISEFDSLNLSPLRAEKEQWVKKNASLKQLKSKQIVAQAKVVSGMKKAEELVKFEKASIKKSNQLSARIAQLEGQVISQKSSYDVSRNSADQLRRDVLVMQIDLENADMGLDDARSKNDGRAEILVGGAQ